MRFPRNLRIFRGQLDFTPFASVFFLLVIFVQGFETAGRIVFEILMTSTRISNAAYLDRELGKAGIKVPYLPKDYKHVYHQYTIRVKDRDNVQKKLADMGVGTGVYYPQGLHELGPLAKYRTRKLPLVEKACKEVLALPVHPALSKADLETVAKSVVKAVA